MSTHLSYRVPAVWLTIWLVCALLQTVHGQILPERSFLEFRLQSNQYSGDRGLAGLEGADRLVQSFGPGASLAVGYHWTNTFEVAIRLSRGTYPGIRSNASGRPTIEPSRSSSSRTSIALTTNTLLLPSWRVSPFVTAGVGLALGRINDRTSTGSGPLLGVGVRYRLFGLTFYSSLEQHYIYPNDALDLAGSDASPDALTAVSLGTRYVFRRRAPRLGSVVVTGPAQLDQGAEGPFRVTLDVSGLDASVVWDFGDGVTATGPVVSHAYRDPGVYRVEVTIMNEREQVQKSLTIRVMERFTPVEIVTILVDPRQAYVGDEVTFSPRIRGEDYTCTWEFGLETRTSCDAAHTFDSAGTFQVTLTVSNPHHSARQVQYVDVRDDACRDLPALRTVYFQFRSIELTTEMRELLRENFSTASACPNLTISVVGGAHNAEPDAENLARERASRVVQYYLNLGMSARSVSAADEVVVWQPEEGELPWTLRNATSFLRAN